MPTIAFITSGKVHEVNILDKLPIEAGAIYIMDRDYLGYARLYNLHQSAAYFVTRAKNNAKYHWQYYQKIDKTSGLKSDQIITLHGYYARKDYPERLRRITYYDEKQNLVFLMNNFTLPARTTTEIYRKHWQIELFFKWIKQHLRIKAFYGTSENAVKTQIWIAISVYVLVAIIKRQLNLEQSLYAIVQIISVTLFEKIPLLQALADTEVQEDNTIINNQLNLFN
jgi:IS4 transposase